MATTAVSPDTRDCMQRRFDSNPVNQHIEQFGSSRLRSYKMNTWTDISTDPHKEEHHTSDGDLSGRRRAEGMHKAGCIGN